MAELNMALVQMKGLKCRIDDILNVTTYDEHADLRGLHADRKDSDQLFQLRELQKIMRKLADMEPGDTGWGKGIVTGAGA